MSGQPDPANQGKTGALHGLRIIEIAGIGPCPFAGMMLADHGAEVILVERPGSPSTYRDVLRRSRRSIVVDLKQPEGRDIVIALARDADGLIEGLRPGVMERLGIGPDRMTAENPRLVYGRMTGWGQFGPLAHAAGHDINYIALSGALHAIGNAADKPPIPLNLVGDFGAGGMLLAFGMLSAIMAAGRTGRGQIIDAAITDGAALLTSMFYSRGGDADWQGARGSNMLGGAAPFYDSYQTSDDKFIALGAIEPQFYAEALQALGVAQDADFQKPMDAASWPVAKAKLAAIFKTRTQDEWCAALEGADACFAPVLSMRDAPQHPHNLARGTFFEADGLLQPSPAPRFSDSTCTRPFLPGKGCDTVALLRETGYSDQHIDSFLRTAVVQSG